MQSTQKIEPHYDEDLTEIKDMSLKDTFNCSFGIANKFKTNLLGLEPGSSQKFRLVPVKPNLDVIPSVSEIEQGDERNCAFIAALRSIVRRYPNIINKIIREHDEKHVEVKLFRKEKDSFKKVNYKIEKTIFANIPSTFNNFCSLFSSPVKTIEKDWVKLIEKALVINFMNGSYHFNLANFQEYENKGKPLSYDHAVIVLGRLGIYTSLLGCETIKESFHSDKRSELDNLKEKFIQGELITLYFSSNKYGLEDHHAYELVNYAKISTEEFVILSNPWGENNLNVSKNINKVDIASLKMLNEYSTENLSADKSLMIIPIKIFNQIVSGYMCTKDVIKALDELGYIDSSELNQAHLSTVRYC